MYILYNQSINHDKLITQPQDILKIAVNLSTLEMLVHHSAY